MVIRIWQQPVGFIRFVSPKSCVFSRRRHCTGAEGLVRQRTAANQIHAFLLEFGISSPKGLAVIKRVAGCAGLAA